MRGVQGARDLGEDGDRLARVERPVPQTLLQVAALDVAHGDVQQLAALARLVDRDDVRMVDRGRQLRLAQEAVAEGHVLGQAGAITLSATLRLGGRSSAR